MTNKKDTKNRAELKSILAELIKEDKALKEETSKFMENLENGDLKKTLERFKKILENRKKRLSQY